MPGMDGLQATAEITGDPALPGTRIIVLTTFELHEYVFGALRAGASGFLLNAVGPSGAAAEAVGRLTPREREVLALVGRGKSNAEIAERLVLSPLTAKTHVARLFAKLGARDRAQLVVTAYESGVVVPRQDQVS
jgi:DNA-binding NarL/FixJ family response regulator